MLSMACNGNVLSLVCGGSGLSFTQAEEEKSVVITASGRLSHSTIWVSTKGLETFYIDAVIIKCDPIAFVELTNHRYELRAHKSARSYCGKTSVG